MAPWRTFHIVVKKTRLFMTRPQHLKFLNCKNFPLITKSKCGRLNVEIFKPREVRLQTVMWREGEHCSHTETVTEDLERTSNVQCPPVWNDWQAHRGITIAKMKITLWQRVSALTAQARESNSRSSQTIGDPQGQKDLRCSPYEQGEMLEFPRNTAYASRVK